MQYSENPDKQYHIQVGREDIGDYVILAGDPGRIPVIAGFLDKAEKTGENREYVTYTGFLDGVKVSVVSTGIGGPSAAICMEELVKAGAHTFIRVGTCGGIQPEVQSGDAIIATGAIRMEGTSREYAPIEFPAVADFDIVAALRNAAQAQGIRHHVGVVQCKDSFYGQHQPSASPVGYELMNKWEAWKRLGTLGSEMESAALFTVAAALGVRVGTVLLVMANQERAALGMENPVVHSTEKPISIAVEAMREIIRKDREAMLSSGCINA